MAFYTVKNDSVTEFTEKKSVFIGHSFFVKDENEAVMHIEEIRKQHGQAAHSVFAYCLRNNGIQRFTDDGEPQGTAGMPVLKVINFNSLTDTCIIVTRYFGGILLGAGGLVRAYTRSAADTVSLSGICEIVNCVNFSLTCGYDFLNVITRILSEFNVCINRTEYLEKVIINATVCEDQFSNINAIIKDKLYDKVLLSINNTCYMRKEW